MPDLLRRVAVLTIVSALGIVALSPLAARSAVPAPAETDRLLDAAEASGSQLRRTTLDGRELSAALTLAERGGPIQVESLGLGAVLPTPPSAPMEATIHLEATPTPAPTPPPTPAPTSAPPPPPSGDSITGKATWYCCTAGYTGQAVVALPGALGGRYDPPPASRTVTVCADRCVELPVVDYCGCYWGTANQKVVDLSPEAWAAVSNAPTSRGVITVTVHL